MQTIEISDEVWECLRQLAVPFVDHSPDDVLRRVLPKLAEARGTAVGGKLAVGLDDGEGKLSKRASGKRARRDYVSRMQREGLTMRLAGGIWAYLEEGDFWIAVPSATERRPNRWFLGISEREVTEKGRAFIVLLCQDEAGSMLDIVLPPEIVVENLHRFSRSSEQQRIVFNIRRDGNRYLLKIPRDEPLDVSGYVGARSLFIK
jgi:hypothetical protein